MMPASTRRESTSSVSRTGTPPMRLATGTSPHAAASITLTGVLSTMFVFKKRSLRAKASARAGPSR